MSKQKNYLAGLLDDGADAAEGAAGAPPSPSPAAVPDGDRAATRAGLSLLGWESALARVASGEVRQVTQLLLDPARVRVWPGNARIQANLSEDSCRDLIDSILAEGGQKVPVVVRRVAGAAGGEPEYELVAGTRRHFAISWLRANNYPQFRLLAQVAELDDEAVFRLADIENRARKDISDIERARNYAQAVDAHYGGRAVRMAERLNLSKGWLSKMLKAAAIPNGVLAAFADLRELTLNPAYKLALALDDPARADAIEREAAAIVAEVQAGEATPPPPAAAVLKRLLAAMARPAPPPMDFRMEFAGSRGRPVLVVKSVNRHGITVQLPLASGASDRQIADAVRQMLDVLRRNGVTVQ